MKRILAIVMCCVMVLSGCGVSKKNDEAVVDNKEKVSFKTISEPELLTYMEDTIYQELVTTLDSEEYFVENIEAVYYSKEYLEELEYNSKENLYFGYTLSSLNELFQGERYVFTLGEDGKTTVTAFEEYDDTYDKALLNVATGAGLILVCVTVSIAIGGSAPAVSLIFAASAKSGSAMALSSGLFSAVTAGVVTGVQTKDVEMTIKSMALTGSEGFKWGAFSGILTGGITETTKYAQAMKALKGTQSNGLTMEQAAAIQMESKYPVDVIKQFKTMEQYKICKSAGLKPTAVNGKTALVRSIDLNYVDEATGMTNLELMKGGYAPVDPATGGKYQLHHIGQKADSTLAILTEAEHKTGGNNTIWHDLSVTSEVHISTNNWDTQRKQFWKAMYDIFTNGGVKK